MPAVHTAIANVSTSVQVAPSRFERVSLYIRNYFNSTGSLFVALGQIATAGTAGEIEIIPGGEYTWNGVLTPIQSGSTYIPTDSVNIIVSGGSATGAVVEYL